jgi:hypothetical protein
MTDTALGSAQMLEPGAAVLDFQAALLAAVTPFTESGGTPAAFVTDPGQSISQSTMDWVDGYVPAQIGEGRYIAPTRALSSRRGSQVRARCCAVVTDQPVAVAFVESTDKAEVSKPVSPSARRNGGHPATRSPRPEHRGQPC